jgi:hypothetical protein
VFEKKLLRIAFGSKRNGFIRGLRKLYNEQLRNLHYSINNITIIKERKVRLARYVACMEKKMSTYRVLIGEPEGNY